MPANKPGATGLTGDNEIMPCEFRPTNRPLKTMCLWLARATLVVVGFVRLLHTPSFSQSANDGFDPNVNGLVWAMLVQPDGRILIGGEFSSVGGVARTNLARLNVDGSVDSSFNPQSGVGAGWVRSLAVQTDGKILVGGRFDSIGGLARTNIARLYANGSVDTNFNATANGIVYSLVVQPDGKILVGGGLYMLAGRDVSGLGRLTSDGTYDESFEPHCCSGDDFGSVYDLALQQDGRILVGGHFAGGLLRLNSNGGLDTSFNRLPIGLLRGAETAQQAVSSGGNAWANDDVFSIVVQADGKIVLGGLFTSLLTPFGPTNRNYIARLNANGSLDASFNPGARGPIRRLAMQADGKILASSSFTNPANQSYTGLGRLNPDGSLDTSFRPHVPNAVLSLATQPDGKILVGGSFTNLNGQARNRMGRLYTDGSLDTTLDSGNGGQEIYSVALQHDGKLIVSGYFTNLFGEPRRHIARLNAGGSLNQSFTAEADYYVKRAALQSDGKILVSGGFTNLNGQPRRGIGRFNADGSLDGTFDPDVDNSVDAMAVQQDGKIVAAGAFLAIAGEARTNIARLNPDGTLDRTFNARLHPWVNCLALQSDGKILVGGIFTEVNGQTRSQLVRLLEDGTTDLAFNLALTRSGFSSFARVHSVVVQPDGKIIFGGGFDRVNGQSHTNLARLNSDGSVDETFSADVGRNTSGLSPDVFSITLQADGKILVGGYFNTLNGETRNLIARLNTDGNLDDSFIPGPSGAPQGWSPCTHSLVIQPDGKIIVPGSFTELSGQTRFRFGRLTSSGPAMQRLSLGTNNASILWTRGGTAPEVQRVTFERSTDGESYAPLGDGIHVEGGWELVGLELPTGQNFYIRARGWVVGGSFNGSSGLVESVAQFWRLPPPFISSARVLGGGVFQFSFANTNAVAFSVLASTNVAASTADWENLGPPVFVSDGLYQFTDTRATNHSRRFYQLRSQ